MRLLIAVLVVGLAAAAWWSMTSVAPRPADVAPPTPSRAAAAPAAPAAPASRPSPDVPQFAPRVHVTSESAPAPGPATPAAALDPLRFSVVAVMLLPGQKPALTLLLDGNSITVREGDTVAGYRVQSIASDRVTLVHLATQSQVERLYADLSAPAGPVVPVPAPATVASAHAPAPSAPFGPAPAAVAAPAPQPPPRVPATPYMPPRPPAGASVHDNPLVGAVLPHAPGQAPPGISGPRPSPTRPGDPVPAGPVATPVPPGVQGPQRR